MTDDAERIIDEVIIDLQKQKEEGNQILQDMEKDPNLIQ